MDSNLSLSLNTQEILSLNSNIKSLDSDIRSYLSSINTNLMLLQDSVQSKDLIFKIIEITDSISTIGKNIAIYMDRLSTFLDSQMKNYEDATVEATKMLLDAIEFIKTTYLISENSGN